MKKQISKLRERTLDFSMNRSRRWFFIWIINTHTLHFIMIANVRIVEIRKIQGENWNWKKSKQQEYTVYDMQQANKGIQQESSY